MSKGRASASTPHEQLVDQLASAIQGRIMTGDIPLGTWLRQERLAAEFGVSRTPVREALHRLEAARMLELVPNRGALVRGPSAQDIREAYVVRAELEGLAAELAARNISPAQLRELKRAEDLFRRSVDSHKARAHVALLTAQPEWGTANDLFHEVVQAAAGNSRLTETISLLHRGFPRNLTWSALSTDRSLLLENVEQHRRIREAVESGRSKDARRLMLNHLAHAGELVANWFERAQGQPAPGPARSNRARAG